MPKRSGSQQRHLTHSEKRRMEWANVHTPPVPGHECYNPACEKFLWGPHTHLDQIAFEHGQGPLCLSGGMGSAKTHCLCNKAMYISDLFPRNRGVIARRQWTTLKDTTMSTFFKICPPEAYAEATGGRRSDSEKYLRFSTSQSEILWLHLDQDDIDKVIRGLEINWFILDQAEEIPEEVFTMLLGRLGRWDKAQVPDWFLERSGGIEEWPNLSKNDGHPLVPIYPMLTANPEGYDHWIYKRFHEDSREWQSKFKDLGYKMIHMVSDENRFLNEQNLNQMKQQDESWQRRFRWGHWGIPEGQIHDVRDDSIIEGSPEVASYLMRNCSLSLTMDHGDSSPTTAGWWAVDQDGNVFCFAEYYQGDRIVSEHRAAIKRIETELCRIAGIPELRYADKLADPAIFYKTMQKYGGRASISDDYQDRDKNHGFRDDDAIFWNPADNDEFGTRNIINEYLKPQGNGKWKEGVEEPRIHPITKERGFWPRLFFLKKGPMWPLGCDYAILETKNQKRVRIGTEMGKPTFSDDRAPKIPDHAYDFVRYFMASRAQRPRQAAKTYPKNSFGAKREEYLAMKRNKSQFALVTGHA